jgi:hypothetical protein
MDEHRRRAQSWLGALAAGVLASVSAATRAEPACQLLQIAELPVTMLGNTPWSLIAQSVMTNPDMLIGADFFLSHRIYVARSQGKIYFTYKGGPIFQHVSPESNAPSANGAQSGAMGAGDPAKE